MKAYEMAAELKGPREEVERLRHDIERHIAMASELATENERLRSENSAAWDSAEYNAQRARKAEAAIGKLLEYAGHRSWCDTVTWMNDRTCDCGYDALTAEVEGTK